jgi:non-homologous end joining protein Ku
MSQHTIAISLRLPKEIREQVKEIAEKEHWTFNQAMVEAAKLLIETKNQTSES